jgi:hypothetical protein
VEIDLQRYRRAATLVATGRVLADQEASEIAPVASADLEGSEIGQAASVGRVASAASADLDAPAASAAPAALVASEIGRESAIDLELEIGSRTPATDTTFGRTLTTIGITGTGTAIGDPGASVPWRGV